MENLDEFEGQWNKLIPKLQKKYDTLTDDDLLLDDDHLLMEGKQYELLERLQQKLGKTRKELCELFHELLGHDVSYKQSTLA